MMQHKAQISTSRYKGWKINTSVCTSSTVCVSAASSINIPLLHIVGVLIGVQICLLFSLAGIMPQCHFAFAFKECLHPVALSLDAVVAAFSLREPF